MSAARLRREVPAVLALVAATVLVYARVGAHEFVSLDDGSYITKNPLVLAGLSWRGVAWAFTRFHSANWHPLTWLAHMLDVELFGLDAGAHHLVSVGLHALNACLCFWALRRLTGQPGPSLLVAFLFALHPLRVESVAWASERKDVLAGTFFFLTLWLHARHAAAPSRARQLAVFVSLALGLLAKPMLVTLPPLLLVLDLWPLRRHTGPGARSMAALVREKLALFALVAGSVLLTLAAQHSGGTVRSLARLDWGERVATAVLGYVAYLAKTVVPTGLACFYPHPALEAPRTFEPLGAGVLLSALLLAALSVAAFRVRRRAPAVPVGWAWFLGLLVPVIGLVQVGRQWIADRYAYLPLVGVYVAVVFGAVQLLPAWRRPLAALGLAVCALYGVLAYVQVGHWRTSETLYAQAVAVAPDNAVARVNLGATLELRGELAGARVQYEAALAVAPREPKALDNLIRVLVRLGEREAAIAALERKLELRPGDAEARRRLDELRRSGATPRGP